VLTPARAASQTLTYVAPSQPHDWKLPGGEHVVGRSLHTPRPFPLFPQSPMKWQYCDAEQCAFVLQLTSWPFFT
jgi:hypothetical protein